MKENCIFCKIRDKEIPASIVHEDEKIIAFNDANPQAPIHVIIIPKKHIEKISDLKEEDSNLIAKALLAGNRIAEARGVARSGYRFVINCDRDAGQAVFHIHIHLLGGRKMEWPPG